MVLNDLQPQRVFFYFEELSGIPRGSGNTKEVSDYCVEFAKKHKLKYRQDEKNNIVIWKAASEGRESDNGVILQGHLDMVNEKTKDSKHSFEKDGLALQCDNDFISAKDTTLGGDDGIAVAIALAILEDNTISHPALEAIFTVDEEIGMLGAADMDISDTTGKYVLNLDSEEEGVFLVSCAGGRSVECKIAPEYEEKTGMVKRINIHGLKGGHSGTEIDKERASSHIIAARILYELAENMKMRVVTIKGGTKDNVISKECAVDVLINAEDEEIFNSTIAGIRNDIIEEYIFTDNNIAIDIESEKEKNVKCGTKAFTDKVVKYLMLAPQGIANMAGNDKAFVETSLNMGALMINDESGLKAVYSVRSSVSSRKELLCKRLRILTEQFGGIYSETGDYPAWMYKKESKLRETMISIYKEMFNKEPVVQSIHAGVECGYLMNKRPELDIVSFGPDIYDIHTTDERLSISSTKRTYDFVIEILKQIK